MWKGLLGDLGHEGSRGGQSSVGNSVRWIESLNPKVGPHNGGGSPPGSLVGEDGGGLGREAD